MILLRAEAEAALGRKALSKLMTHNGREFQIRHSSWTLSSPSLMQFP
jgi:hypothetical protein